MEKKCLEGYSESFIKYLQLFGDIDYISEEELKSVLPSKELVRVDEGIFNHLLDSQFGCLLVPISGKEAYVCDPISYLYTVELIKGGDLSKVTFGPERPFYVLMSSEKEIVDGKETYKKAHVPATFTKQEFLESTAKFGTGSLGGCVKDIKIFGISSLSGKIVLDRTRFCGKQKVLKLEQ